jgi:hypothetical protein
MKPTSPHVLMINEVLRYGVRSLRLKKFKALKNGTKKF